LKYHEKGFQKEEAAAVSSIADTETLAPSFGGMTL
jgi:hypothetical protein